MSGRKTTTHNDEEPTRSLDDEPTRVARGMRDASDVATRVYQPKPPGGMSRRSLALALAALGLVIMLVVAIAVRAWLSPGTTRSSTKYDPRTHAP